MREFRSRASTWSGRGRGPSRAGRCRRRRSGRSTIPSARGRTSSRRPAAGRRWRSSRIPNVKPSHGASTATGDRMRQGRRRNSAWLSPDWMLLCEVFLGRLEDVDLVEIAFVFGQHVLGDFEVFIVAEVFRFGEFDARFLQGEAVVRRGPSCERPAATGSSSSSNSSSSAKSTTFVLLAESSCSL